MSTDRGASLLHYRPLPRANLDSVLGLQFSPDQVTRFLGPLDGIIDAVRDGPAHAMVGIEADGVLVGFYVLHPDLRDAACWWLGWFAIDHRRQGRGYGQLAMAAIMRRLCAMQGCRVIRLLAAPDNAHALSLYRRAGFRQVDVDRDTGEFVMEYRPDDGVPFDAEMALVLAHVLSMSGHVRAARLAGLARGARVHSALHGPPTASRRAVGRVRTRRSAPLQMRLHDRQIAQVRLQSHVEQVA